MTGILVLVILAIIIFVFYFANKKEGVRPFGGPRWGPRGRGWYRNVPGWQGGWRGGGWGWGAAAPVVVYDYEGPPIGYAPPSYCTGCSDCNNPLCRYCPQCW